MNITRISVDLMFLLSVVPCALSQQANVSASSLNFGSQVMFVAVSGGYQQTNDWSIVSPHASCTVNVTFRPGTTGALNGAITIVDNAASSPQIVNLFETGIAPVQLTPKAVSFGTVTVGTASQPQLITLIAAPGTSFSINQISTSGDFGSFNILVCILNTFPRMPRN